MTHTINVNMLSSFDLNDGILYSHIKPVSLWKIDFMFLLEETLRKNSDRHPVFLPFTSCPSCPLRLYLFVFIQLKA